MKRLLIVVIGICVLMGCASTTIIKTLPEGARVKQNGMLKGLTPYEHWDREESNYVLNLTLSKEGYKDKEVVINKDVLYLHRLILPPIISLPWLFGYDTSYLFELEKN